MVATFLQELMHAGIYKRSQGRITRQLTFGALALTIALTAWRLYATLKGFRASAVASVLPGFEYWLPAVFLVAGLWICYRIVNLPSFADFLIAVEAEMNKVSWPSRTELFRASIVVLFTIFFLAATLAGFDFFWRVVFTHVLRLF